MRIVRYRGMVPAKYRLGHANLPSKIMLFRISSTSQALWFCLLALRGEEGLTEEDLGLAVGAGTTAKTIRSRMEALSRWGLAYKIGEDYVVSHTPITLRKATAILEKSRRSVCGG